MNPLVVIVIAAMIIGIVYLSHLLMQNTGGRDRSLQKLADFLEGKLEPLEGFDNSYKIEFEHKGKSFVYEDVEDKGFSDVSHYRAFLKHKTSTPFVLSFTEKSRTQMRANIKSLQDVVRNPWGSKANDLATPKGLEEFTIFTNQIPQANELFANEQIVDIFVRYKNIDARGYPVMSLEIPDGTAVLRFHGEGELKPNLFDLRSNVASIEHHLDNMVVIIDKVESFINNR